MQRPRMGTIQLFYKQQFLACRVKEDVLDDSKTIYSATTEM